MTQSLSCKRITHLTSILALTLLMVTVLIGCGSPATESPTVSEPESPTVSEPESPTAAVAITPTDSSSCIACHTDAGIIESMAELVDDGGHGGEGG